MLIVKVTKGVTTLPGTGDIRSILEKKKDGSVVRTFDPQGL